MAAVALIDQEIPEHRQHCQGRIYTHPTAVAMVRKEGEGKCKLLTLEKAFQSISTAVSSCFAPAFPNTRQHDG